MNAKKQLEICVDSLESLHAAVDGGADRIELCSALSLGGLTPSVGLLRCAREAVADVGRLVPRHEHLFIYCMLRCRNGDFVYDDSEMATMVADLQQLRVAGADGFVFGALDNKGNVNVEQCSRIAYEATNMPLTFHRAFDVCTNWRDALKAIASLPFAVVLTSGQASTAAEAVLTLQEIIEATPPSISIMVGSGVSPSDINELLRQIPATQWHASASESVPSMHKTLWGDTNERRRTNASKVRQLRHALDAFPPC